MLLPLKPLLLESFSFQASGFRFSSLNLLPLATVNPLLDCFIPGCVNGAVRVG